PRSSCARPFDVERSFDIFSANHTRILAIDYKNWILCGQPKDLAEGLDIREFDVRSRHDCNRNTSSVDFLVQQRFRVVNPGKISGTHEVGGTSGRGESEIGDELAGTGISMHVEWFRA